MRPEFEQITKKLIEKRRKELQKELNELDSEKFAKQLIKDIKKAQKMSISTTVSVNGETHVFKATSKGVEVKKVKPTYDQINYDERI